MRSADIKMLKLREMKGCCKDLYGVPLKIVTHSCFFFWVQFYIALIMDFGV